MTQTKKQLVHAILNFLSNEKEADADSLTVASSVISDAYSVDASDASLALPSQYTLLDVFNAGLTSLNIAQPQQQQQTATTTAPAVHDDLEGNPKYQAFIKQLNDMGYFNNCDEETKKQRMEKAKEKFLSRSAAATTGSATTFTASASTTTTTTTTSFTAAATSSVDKAAAEKFKNEGNDHLKQKQYKLAIESYKKAIQADPTNAIYPANMAAAFMQLRDYDNAEKCCKKAIEIDPKYGKARSRLALIYQRTGRLNEAIEQLEDALEHDPNNAEEYTAKLNELIGSSGGGAPSTQHAPSNPFAAMMGGMGGMGGGGGNPLAGLANMMGGMGGGAGGGMPDFGSLLSNPEFMRTAMDLMQRPEMQSMVQNMMGGFMGGGAGGGEEEGGENPLGLDEAALEKVLADPEVQNNPRLKQIFEECREKGLNHSLQYLSDPEVVGFMTRFVQRKMGGGGMETDDN